MHEAIRHYYQNISYVGHHFYCMNLSHILYIVCHWVIYLYFLTEKLRKMQMPVVPPEEELAKARQKRKFEKAMWEIVREVRTKYL